MKQTGWVNMLQLFPKWGCFPSSTLNLDCYIMQLEFIVQQFFINSAPSFLKLYLCIISNAARRLLTPNANKQLVLFSVSNLCIGTVVRASSSEFVHWEGPAWSWLRFGFGHVFNASSFNSPDVVTAALVGHTCTWVGINNKGRSGL